MFGDIGTSPIYAFRECFAGERLPPSPENVLGVLSLVTWSLLIVVSLKYLAYVLRADNGGEGGVLALLALLDPWSQSHRRPVLAALGVFGAALLYGDGILTPAISVLSAVEGLGVATPALDRFVRPISVLILAALFAFQRRGTATVGALFGPVMLVWFASLAALGISGIAGNPAVLSALSPTHAVSFLLHGGAPAFAVLGAVFLVVTGAEALYADMGHFGASAVRRVWFSVVLPALLLDYYGQGALMLDGEASARQPFFELAPDGLVLPLVLLATCATVIASQAVISGAFSLTRQAIQLGECPRLRVEQTSARAFGQVYVPTVNALLFIATVALVLGYGSSSRLAGAYGIAVATTMVVTTILAGFVSVERWGWNPVVAVILGLGFLSVDLPFLSANLLKINDGGWIPLLVAAAVFTLMTTWRRGRELLAPRLFAATEPIHQFLHRIEEHPPRRIPGTAVVMTDGGGATPPILLHQIEHLGVLQERVVLLTVVTDRVPQLRDDERVHVLELRSDFFRVEVHYGFIERPDVPAALRLCSAQGLEIDPLEASYLVGRETLIASHRPGMAFWRDKLFAFLSRNSTTATSYYRIPPQLVIELGIQIEI